MKEQRLAKLLHTKKGQRILFDQYYVPMYAVAFRYVRLKEDAEDALSEAFVRVFRYADNFEYREDGSLRKWIKTIVINEALRVLQRKKSLVMSDEISDADLEYTDNVEGNIDMEYFLTIVNTLPNGYRVVFLMFVVEEFTHKEIAEKLNISISTSKSQLFKARGLLVKRIKKIEAHETFGYRKTI